MKPRSPLAHRLLALFVGGVLVFSHPLLQLWLHSPVAMFAWWAALIAAVAWWVEGGDA